MAITFFQTLQSFSQALGNYILSGGQLVDVNTANIRADICVTCHNNKPSGDIRGGCGVCNKGANKMLDALRGHLLKNRSTPVDKRLLACGICGCDLKLMVHFPNESLITKADANAFPSFCWKKKILEDAQL